MDRISILHEEMTSIFEDERATIEQERNKLEQKKLEWEEYEEAMKLVTFPNRYASFKIFFIIDAFYFIFFL